MRGCSEASRGATRLIRPRVHIRPAELGDHGWVLERHAHLYPPEEGWGEPFVGLVAGVIAEFLDGRDQERERGWIAELDGERAGSVYCTMDSDRVARLRLLFVESWARGQGIGGALVERCIAFAREAGYERITLWTNSSLESARRIYDTAGFRLTAEETSPVFPEGTLAQEYILDL